MQLVTALERGAAGIPLEAMQGIEFANAEDARQLIHYLGAFAHRESQKSPKGFTPDSMVAHELAAHFSQQVQSDAIGEYPVSSVLRDPRRRAYSAVLHRLAWHHGIPVTSATKTNHKS